MNGSDFLEDAAAIVEYYRDAVAADLEGIPEALLWKRPVPGMVSPANLVFHLAGNLRHFFGHELGGTDYVRTRDHEFEEGPYAGKAEILDLWQAACRETASVFTALDPRRLDDSAPVEHYPGGCSVHLFTTRLLGHLGYHAGQIRMLRRLLAPIDD